MSEWNWKMPWDNGFSRHTTDEIPDHDPVNHPRHYTEHPSGVECIQITEHMNFCLGNAVKYIWRADLKHDVIEDIDKAVWYLLREKQRRLNERLQKTTTS